MLSVRDIEVSYGKSRVIQGISFDVAQDEKLVIIGRNGVGKTTLLKSIVGLLSLNQGEISLFNENISKDKAFTRSQKGIAYVPQGREIIPDLTVQENLELGALAHKVDYAEKVEEIFEYFPILKDHLKRKGGVLSGGQQQQLSIARALMSNPKILLLDEPTEGIQPNIVMEISNILTRYHQEKGVPIVVVEQNLKFARKLGDRFLIIQRGQIVADGQIDELTDELSESYLSV
ncbi:MAG: urea ABC transporter ATP-binding subunit UrtE [Streptococcaceae bacterium]|jgi:urea transport system ATP-binding protein|nr:urea ABC transporter ATP-binding subunit UrtE [Streptococcaceae bacterium]